MDSEHEIELASHKDDGEDYRRANEYKDRHEQECHEVHCIGKAGGIELDEFINYTR